MYEGQEFVLQFKFGPQYPMESPEVRRPVVVLCGAMLSGNHFHVWL